MCFLTKEDDDATEWIIDSGSTSHMVNDKKLFKAIENVNTRVGIARNNVSMRELGVGVVELQECELRNVIYVPELTTNLISVNAITNQDGEVIFVKDKVLIKKEGKIRIKGVKNKNGLYEVMLQKELRRSYLANNKTENTKLWHWRLRHLGLDNIKKLLKMSTGINLHTEEMRSSEEPCEICLKSKHLRTPHIEIRRRAERCFELIHTDVCGPIDPNTWDGNKYFITFLDDYSNYVTVHLIKNKSEVPGLIKSYVKQMEKKSSQKVAQIRCDNGREYANEDLQN